MEICYINLFYSTMGKKKNKKKSSKSAIAAPTPAQLTVENGLPSKSTCSTGIDASLANRKAEVCKLVYALSISLILTMQDNTIQYDTILCSKCCFSHTCWCAYWIDISCDWIREENMLLVNAVNA